MKTDANADGSSTNRVRRRWLALAQAAWIVCAALALLIFLAAIPLGYVHRFSGTFGVPIDAPAWYIAVMSFAQGVVSMLTALLCLAIAALLFWKRCEEPMALFVSFFLLAYGIVLAGPLEALNGFPLLSAGVPSQLGLVISADAILEIQSALFALMPLLFYLFPNGRFVPGWTRYAALLVLLLAPAFIRVFSANWPSTMTPFAWLIFTAWVVLLGAGIYAQIYRYRRVATPIERQQSKWVVFGLVLYMGISAVLQIPYIALTSIPLGTAHPWWQPMTGLVWVLSFIILPLSLAVAVMHYRLWDIDLIINRALVYGTLTAMVVGSYVLIIGVFSALFQTRGDLATSVIAIGILVALLRPLRDRVQRAVNRLMLRERDSSRLSSDVRKDNDEDGSRDGSLPSASSTRAWMRPRSAAWLAWALWALTLCLTAFSLLFLFLNRSTRPYPESFCCSGVPGIELSSLAVACVTVGALIASRRSENLVGWIFIASGLGLAVHLFAILYAIYTGVTRPGSLPLGAVMSWIGAWAWVPGWGLLLIFLLLLFPNGRLPSRQWRPVAWFAAGVLAANVLALALMPGELDWSVGVFGNPFGLAAFRGSLEALSISILLLPLSILVAGVSLLIRLRGAGGEERQQIKWLAYASALAGIVFFASTFFYGNELFGNLWFQLFAFIPFLGIPIAAGIAILKYRLYDIDLLINRTLVYGALTASILALYVVTVGALGTLLQTNNDAAGFLLATILAAFLFRPLRAHLQRSVNRAMFGAANASPSTGGTGMPSPKHEIEASQPNSELPVRRRWLMLAHIAWLVCAAIALLIFAASIPPGYAPLLGGTYYHPINAQAWYVAVWSFASAATSILAVLISFALAALLFWKKRAEPMALFISFYLMGYAIFIAGPLEAFSWFHAQTYPIFISQIGSALYFVPPILFLYLFPNGRFVPRWTRGAALLLLLLLTPSIIFTDANAWADFTNTRTYLNAIAYCGLVGAGVYAQIYRYRRAATLMERQQIKWGGFGVSLYLFLIIVSGILWVTVSNQWANSTSAWAPVGDVTWWLLMSILPLTLAVAVMRYRLWDIDLIIHRALVYGALTAGIVALYVLLVGALSALSQTSGNLLISLLATGLIALLFQPLRERLQRGVNHLIYGERDEPYAVISRLGQRLEATLAPAAILVTLVRTIAQALKLPYVAIKTSQGDDVAIAAEYGEALSDAQRVPLTYQAETVGYLLVAPRSPNEPLSPADLNLLRIIAQQAGMAVHAVRLTEDLQRSRERLVVAREEERRRIRRDLHDGLGPALASLAMQADNAREWTQSDPSKAEAALADIAAKAQNALQDIRRLVYDLRPPALDEVGLVGALQQTAANSPNGLHIEIDVPEALPPLSAAVEVAAYRIAQGTLNNVARHSYAQNCTVRLSVQDELRLEISDDGVGFSPDVRAGVGLVSMRERAAELGGSCVIESERGGGTRVTARLPLAHYQGQDG